MVLGLNVNEMLIISLFFITAINCVITYYCCTKSLKIFENNNSYGEAINKLRIYDQYVLSKINLIVCLFYFYVSYFFFDSLIEWNGYVFFLSCLLSLSLTLVTVFVSRLCYCYTCNVLLETKLNELDCLIINFKRLITVYVPFIVVSLVVPTIYMFNINFVIKNILCILILFFIVIVWGALVPKITILNYRAKKIENNSLLRYRLEKLFEAHGIKNYELYYWNSSRSKEANAMVSGIKKYHLFVSTTLIDEVTLPELETIITHEIGHIKNKHLLKMMIGKVFIAISIIFMVAVPYVFKFNDFNKILFYILTVFIGILEIIAAIAVERNYEIQADMYATCFNDSILFESALKKISKHKEDEVKLDKLFRIHPTDEKRIKIIKKTDK